MSAASSSLSAVCRKAVSVPLICCPDCKKKVRMYVSMTDKHDGRIFYKCVKHRVTCDFRRWELEYVEYLVDKHYLVGDAVVDAIGATKERREELLIAQEHSTMNATNNRTRQGMKNQAGNGMTRQQVCALMRLGRELVMLMKLLVAVVVLMGVAGVVFMLKK